MKNKIIKIFLRILQGVFDAIAPNVKNSIKGKEFDPHTNKPKVQIDWLRLLSAGIMFILLVLNFFGLIDAKEVIKYIYNELQGYIPG